MKHIAVLIAVTVFVAVSGIAMAGSLDEPKVGFAADPPDGAMVTMAEKGNGNVVVTVKGMEVYNDNLYVYNDGNPYAVKFVDGSAETPPRTWNNIIFKGDDGNWHYLLISNENQSVPEEWMGPGTCVLPDYGRGAALVYCGWLRSEYRGQ